MHNRFDNKYTINTNIVDFIQTIQTFRKVYNRFDTINQINTNIFGFFLRNLSVICVFMKM